MNTKEIHAKVAAKLRGGKLSREHKNAIKKAVDDKIKDGTWHVSISHARRYEYRGIQLHGLWEVAYAKHLDATGVEWRRPTESFPYQFEERERRYTPDFYLPGTDEYVEVKGWPTAKDRAKWAAFPGKLKVLLGEDLHRMGLIENFKKVRMQ